MNTNEKLAEIFENEQFKLEVQNVEIPEDFQALLAEYGLEMTLEEVNELFEQAAAYVNAGELSEEELEDVAGGKGNGTLKKIIKTVIRVGVKIAKYPRHISIMLPRRRK